MYQEPGPHGHLELPWRVQQSMTPCFVAPSPDLRDRVTAELAKLKGRKSFVSQSLGLAKEPRALGFNDGAIIPVSEFPFGTPDMVIRAQLPSVRRYAARSVSSWCSSTSATM